MPHISLPQDVNVGRYFTSLVAARSSGEPDFRQLRRLKYGQADKNMVRQLIQEDQMVNQKYVEVTIGGKIYELGGPENPEYLQRVATYINSRIGELRSKSGFLRQSAEYQNVMIQLNLADDYFREKQRADQLEERVERLEKEAYDLKHQLVSNQIKNDKV